RVRAPLSNRFSIFEITASIGAPFKMKTPPLGGVSHNSYEKRAVIDRAYSYNGSTSSISPRSIRSLRIFPSVPNWRLTYPGPVNRFRVSRSDHVPIIGKTIAVPPQGSFDVYTRRQPS